MLKDITFRQIVKQEAEHVMFLKLELFVIKYLCGRNQCPNFYTGRIQLENKLNMLVSENAGFNENYLHRKFSAKTSTAKSKNLHYFFI